MDITPLEVSGEMAQRYTQSSSAAHSLAKGHPQGEKGASLFLLGVPGTDLATAGSIQPSLAHHSGQETS